MQIVGSFFREKCKIDCVCFRFLGSVDVKVVFGIRNAEVYYTRFERLHS